MNDYRKAGFRVEVLVMGVPRAISDQGVIARYHEQVKDRGSGRLTMKGKVEASFLGILELASLIDRDRLAHQVGTLRRGEGVPRYANSLDEAGAWQRPAALRTAIETLRSHPLSEAETHDFLRTQGRLRRELGAEWSSDLGRIEQMAKPLMRCTRTYAYWIATKGIRISGDPMQPSLGPAALQGPPGPRTGPPRQERFPAAPRSPQR